MAGNNANKISIIFTLFEIELHYTDLILYNLALMQIKIWKILVDNRANHIYSKGILGPHIIECYFSHYSKENLTIYLKYPVDDSLKNKYSIGISFTDENLFREVRNKLFNNDNDLKYPVLVIGNWQYDNKKKLVQTSINSSFQIYFRK